MQRGHRWKDKTTIWQKDETDVERPGIKGSPLTQPNPPQLALRGSPSGEVSFLPEKPHDE